jgi:membrane fusion protein, multidrug efflux system
VEKLKLTIGIIGLIILFSCHSAAKEENKTASKPAAAKVDGYVVAPQLLSQDIEVPGSLAAYEEVELHPEVSGRVTAVYFKEGSNVGQGSLLLKIYDGDLQAQLQKLQIQIKTAEKTTERYGALLKINGVSQQEYDLNVLAVNNIRADMNIVKTNMARTTLRAPFSGKIGITSITKGSYVTPQTLIGTLRKVSQLKLNFAIPEIYSTKIKKGDLVRFTVEGNNEIHPAIVSATENIIAEDNRSLSVIATVVKPGTQLIAGAFAKVKIVLGGNTASLMVPTQAIIPQARNKKIIIVRDGMAVMETVTTGTRDSSMVEITSGLKAGDTILTTGLLSTKPGSKVQLNKVITN